MVSDFTANFDDGVATVQYPERTARRGIPPLWTWLLLAAAVTAVSSAGAVFASMPEVPILTLASWRLQLTSLLLLLAGSYQYWCLPADRRQQTLQQSWLLALSGTFLAVHFWAFVYSIQHTSLSHTLLFISCTPLLLAGGAWLLRKPISCGELVGTGVGVAGAVILATAAARSDDQVTLRGDMAALLGALTFVGYLLIGQRLRRWMPLFVYAFAVTGTAALLLTLAAAAVEGARLGEGGTGGSLGWAVEWGYLPRILYLAVFPGILGHQGFNTLLSYMDPLLITLGCNMEPLIGSVLGWAAGVMAPPGPWTYAGGALVMLSTLLVTAAAQRRQQAASGGGGGHRYTPVSSKASAAQNPPLPGGDVAAELALRAATQRGPAGGMAQEVAANELGDSHSL